MAVGVSKARKRYGVKYPAIYAADGAPNAKEFNCIQRGARFIPSLRKLTRTVHVLTSMSGH